MEKENNREANGRSKGILNSIIEESRKLRAERGEDFSTYKDGQTIDTAKIPQGEVNSSRPQKEKDFRSLRDSHVKLAHLIVNYDKKILDKISQEPASKKARSKSVHLYVDETIETFLSEESGKAETRWGLRKNAGLGQLIQKFIGNFIELKKREERQLKKIKKLIDDFRSHLVDFKKTSGDPDDYLKAEMANQKMKVLSSDLAILLSLLEFEDGPLKECLGIDLYSWVDFVVRWKWYS